MLLMLFCLLCGLPAWLGSRRLGVGFGVSLVFALASLWVLPPLAFGHPRTLVMVVVALLLGLVPRERDKVQQRTGAAALVVVGAVLLVAATTWSAFYADRYRGLLSVVDRDFDTQQVLLDQSQARFVDEDLAVRAAEELLGNELGVGSRARIGRMSVQSVNGRLWWVAPLEHKGLLKWLSNGTTSGYVMVSASDYSDARIVDGLALKVGMGGFALDWLPRHVYAQGFTDVDLTDFTFELDDAGHPAWVVTLIAPQVGFGGLMAVGVAVVDPQTGETTRYGVADAPAWIDRIQPEDIVEDRLSDWGAFGKGWWNSWLAGQDVVRASEGMSLVYTVDGHSAWYTGMQSTGTSDQGTMGFVLVDTRTGVASFYRRAGITEAAAKEVIEGQVQEKGYRATWPVPYLVHGVPTFLCTLKDQAGNGQMVGLVAYNDRTTVAVGESAREALRAYASRLRSKGTAVAIEGAAPATTYAGVVGRMATEEVRDETVVYFTLDTVPTQAFAAPAHLTPEVLLSRPGDRVRIDAMPAVGPLIDALRFDNLELSLQPGADDARRAAEHEAAVRAR